MKRARSRAFTYVGQSHQSKRSVFLITLGVCFALLLSSISSLWTTIVTAKFPVTKTRAQQNGSPNRGDRRVAPLPPRFGPPAANLPNLDQLRSTAETTRNNPSRVEAPRPIPSNLRSRRKANELPPGIRPNSAGTRSHHARSRTLKAPRVAPEPLPVVPQSGRTNFALAANGSVATASSTYQGYGFTPAATIDGEHKGLNWLNGGGWNSATSTFPQWVQVDFNATRTIDEIDIFSIQDDYLNPIEPTETTTFSLYGMTAFDVQYWTGSAWLTVPGGSVSGNNKVWKKITFSAISTTKIRMWANGSGDGWSRTPEIEAWGPATSTRTNVALAANGSVATASSTYQGYGFTPAATIDGEHRGLNWLNGGGWSSATSTFPQWVQVDFNATRTIDEIDIFSIQDDYLNPIEPTETTTFSLYGLTGFDVQYWTGAAWDTVPGGSVSGNNKVWKKVTFSAISTTKIRVVTNASGDGWSRTPEIEAWSALSGGGGSPSDFAMARLDPRNRTGTGGEDLLSNNVNWNLPLVGLNGRGLDLGLTLSYNSLVWTKAGNSLAFDLDQGSIAPGFRLGFPTVEGPYFNSQANANFYLLITPSGGRVELRQVGTSTVYESKDSSYLQFTDNLDATATLRPTDGSKMNFIPSSGGWRCNQIKDRNGNYITATYKSWGELETVTDTLGRVIRFVYDTNDNLSCITQGWNGQPAPTTCEQSQPHVWATFGWGTASIGNNFPSLNNRGPNSTSIGVLTQVGLPDGSRYNFEYNNTYGMVSKIRHHASDNRLRRQTSYIAPASAIECPRLTERHDWAANWNGDADENPTTNEEAVSYFSHDADTGCRMTLPDGTVHKEYYGSSWQSGLTTETRSYASVADANSNTWQKKTVSTWTQDDTNAGYLTNPRLTEANVYDASGNRRRTTIDYGSSNLGYVQWGLPHVVKDYAADGTTELRRTQTDYNLNQDYLNRRLIGLVSTSQLYDAVANQWQAKVTYGYDGNSIDSQATIAAQHDQTYNSNFTARGNVTSISRWDVTDIENSAKKLTSTVTYDAAGSVLTSGDPAGHTTTIEYADSFSDDQNHNTFAYATTVRDADSFSSTIKYNFDSGVVTRAQGPPPAGQPHGRIQAMLYDDALRLTRVTTENDGAYTRYVYGPYYVQSFSSVNTANDEAYSCQILDGHGRTYAASGNHPNSTGGYRAQLTRYDIMGRPKQSTNPTEIDSGWAPTGDDADGWQWNNPTEYDWKDRPLKTYNMDGTYKTASYAGCGCAGGEVVTLTDEVGRQQRAYSDVLGRQWKTEILNWNGSVYSTTTNSLNARDQATLIRQWAGAENGGGAYQDTTLAYDVYGRLQSKHVPEQNAGTSTVYAYNLDDTIQSVTDARGASSTFSYNNRRLVTGISYAVPQGSNIPATPNVSFGYDAAGNRTSMDDGSGGRDYEYDSLSRMTSETRIFGSLPNQSFALSYDYNLASELKTISDPWGATINYGFDAIGRLTNITGSGYGSVTQFDSNMHYRAWGTLRSETLGNGFTQSATYNSRLQMTAFEVRKPTNELQMSTSTQFYADGQVQFSRNSLDERFDRAFAYDHAARTSEAYSGSEARDFVNNTNSGNPTGAFRQSYQLNAFNHITQQVNRLWSVTETTTNNFSNNRMQGWTYDSAGFVTIADGTTFTRDAAGRTIHADGDETHATYEYDGIGRLAKSVVSRPALYSGTITTRTYPLISSVLGVAVAEINGSGQKTKREVYAGTRKIAEELYGEISWHHAEPVTGSRGQSTNSGSFYRQAEFNADGIDMGLSPPVETDNSLPSAGWGMLARDHGCSGADPNCQTCFLDHMEFDCGHLAQLATAGALQVEAQNGRGEKKYLDVDERAGQLSYWKWDQNYHREQPPESPDGVIRVNNQGKYIGVPIAAFFPTFDSGERRFALTPQDASATATDRQRDFYNQYQKKLAHCIWKVFSRDYLGKPTAVDGAALLEHQTPNNAPAIDTSRTTATMPFNALGSVSSGDLERGEFGTINMASNIGPMMNKKTGVMMTTAEVWNRTYTHELGNLLGGRIAGSMSGSVTLFGDPRGIENAAGNYWDNDPGARLETCMFGGVAP